MKYQPSQLASGVPSSQWVALQAARVIQGG